MPWNGRLRAHSVNGERCPLSGSVPSISLLTIPHSSPLNPVTQSFVPSTSSHDNIATSSILESNIPDIHFTNSFIDPFLGLPKPRLISRIPCDARQVVTTNYAQCIDRLLKKIFLLGYRLAFLIFGHKSFQILAVNGNSSTKNIKLASSNINYEPLYIIIHTCIKKQDDLNFKVKLIDNKINNLDINGALRLCSSFDTLAPEDAVSYQGLLDKHPQTLEALMIYETKNPSPIFTSKEIFK
ncbi:unnamed protein product [Gordionus sp. m RMFG-2023]